MAIYEYQCTACSAVTERVQSMNDKRPDSIPCKFCQEDAKFKLPLVAVPTSGMSNSPLDVSIGRDAASLWENIHQRQEKRNQVRREAGDQGLAATDYNTFIPISSEQKATRARALDHIARDGHKPDMSDSLTRLANS